MEETITDLKPFRPSRFLGLIASIVLFVLPWVEVSCQNKETGEVQRYWANGFDFATPKDFSKEGWNDYKFGQFLIFAYFLSLLAAVVWLMVLSPGEKRAQGMLYLTGAAVALLLVGMWLLADHPFVLPEPETIGDQLVVTQRFTIWYYASYLCHWWTMGAFVIEYRRSSDDPGNSPRPSSEFSEA